MLTAEQQARVVIDQLLTAAGWAERDVKTAGVIEAKKQGATLTGVEVQSAPCAGPAGCATGLAAPDCRATNSYAACSSAMIRFALAGTISLLIASSIADAG